MASVDPVAGKWEGEFFSPVTRRMCERGM